METIIPKPPLSMNKSLDFDQSLISLANKGGFPMSRNFYVRTRVKFNLCA